MNKIKIYYKWVMEAALLPSSDIGLMIMSRHMWSVMVCMWGFQSNGGMLIFQKDRNPDKYKNKLII